MTLRLRTRQFLGAFSPTQLSRIGVKLGHNSSTVCLQTGRYGRQPNTTDSSFRTLFRLPLRSQETEFYTSRWPNCPSSRTIVLPLSPICSRLPCVDAISDIPSLHSQCSRIRALCEFHAVINAAARICVDDTCYQMLVLQCRA